jgi:hypothetical protein
VHSQPVATSVAVIVWGLAFGSLPVLLQVLALRSSKEAPGVAAAVSSTTFNIGISLGAIVGGQVLAAGSMAGTMLISAGLFIIRSRFGRQFTVAPGRATMSRTPCTGGRPRPRRRALPLLAVVHGEEVDAGSALMIRPSAPTRAPT